MEVELNISDDEHARFCGSATTRTRCETRDAVRRPWEGVGDASNVTRDAGDEVAGTEGGLWW